MLLKRFYDILGDDARKGPNSQQFRNQRSNVILQDDNFHFSPKYHGIGNFNILQQRMKLNRCVVRDKNYANSIKLGIPSQQEVTYIDFQSKMLKAREMGR